MRTTSKTLHGLSGLLAGGLLTAAAATVIALPLAGTANAAPQCNQTVGQSIDSYLHGIPISTSSCRPDPRRRVAAPTSSAT